MDLLQQHAPFVLGPGDHRVGFGQGVVADALDRLPRLLGRIDHHDLRLGHAFGRGALALGLDLIGLALGLPQQARGPFLGLDHDLRRFIMGMAEYLGAVLAEGGGERGLVDHGMRRPLVGLRHGLPELLFPLLEHFDAARHRLEIGLDLVDVETPPDDRKRVAGDVPRRDASGGNG